MDLNKLKQEAEEKAKKRTKGFKCQDNCEKSYVMGALDFAEPREKRIAELEAQIEKMKCCEMCKHKNLNWGFSPICEARDNIKIENPLTCKCDKWEIKEE